MNKEKIEAAVRLFFEGIGEDPSREGIAETPERVARMCDEIFLGEEDDPKQYLKFFPAQSAGSPVIVRDVPFYSVCEHHLLPFFGTVSVMYKPSENKVIGLSKIARIINSFARRPQLQERMTDDICDFLYNNIGASGVCVFAEAEHMCMTMRGVTASGSKTRTLSVRGDISEQEQLLLFK